MTPPGYTVIHLSKWPKLKKIIAVTSTTDEAVKQDHSDIGGDDPKRVSHAGK